MSSSTVSKRLCMLPRQTRALSLYSVVGQHHHASIEAPPPPRPSPTTTSRHPPTNSNGQQQQSHSNQNPTPLALQFQLQLPQSPQPFPFFPSSPFSSQLHTHFSRGLLHAPTRRGKGTRRTLRLDVAAYGIPKRRAHTQPPPHTSLTDGLDLATQVGEDAYFIRPDSLGVSDGVGGWSRSSSPSSANSALFAKSLMHYCSHELGLQEQLRKSHSQPNPPSQPQLQPRHHPASVPAPHPPTAAPPPPLTPLDILDRAYTRSLSSFNALGLTGGSATALLAVLPPASRSLLIAHLGDCAICLVRDGAIAYRSEEMQHAFNYPLQLGPASPTLPAHARTVEIQVREGDIVILSSDGMTDNLWDEDVLDEVHKFSRCDGAGAGAGGGGGVEGDAFARMLSQALCSRAKRVSERRPGGTGQDRSDLRWAAAAGWAAGPDVFEQEVNQELEVPFARRAREEGVKFVGGKCDDISVLVAVISPCASRPADVPDPKEKNVQANDGRKGASS
ncbi:phosphatase 2C-like domain-containing protein [Hysterangium stoloniferum]|nr:phosphatase 2C-like domain-containing protein [Hysterangium stoloniferum]